MAEKTVMLDDPEAIKDFFFEGSLAGYAGSGNYESENFISGLPEKTFTHFNAEGTLKYVDCYSSNGEFSEGVTKIYAWTQNNTWELVWVMSYHGWCKGDDKRYTKYLKERLNSAYKQKKFLGGRGAMLSNPKQGLFYENVWEGNFLDSNGIERIWEKTRKEDSIVFWHRFQGLLLLPH